MLHRNFDFKKPDYLKAFRERMLFVEDIRRHPHEWPVIKAHYREHPADMINDFGVTFDPRNADIGLPTVIPFVLFDRQIEWIDAVMTSWRTRRPLICEKSRDMGVSWLAMSLSSTLCCLYTGLAIGVGSRKGEYVDKIGEHKPLLPKARMFMANLPRELRGSWEAWRDAPHMRIVFPDTGSIISGEGGDNIGRGDRCALYFVDESAHLERPQLVEASLSQTTNCRIDMSSVNGMANPFAQKRWSGKYEVFIFDWRAQPLDAKILTPKGWRLMGEIHTGDKIIGIDGKPTKVSGVYPQGVKDVYRITFNDGTSTESCEDHLWEVIPLGNHRFERRHIRRVMPLKEIMKDYKALDSRGNAINRYQVPLAEPIVGFNKVALPLDPYIMGCLLGDGTLPTKPSSPIYLSIGMPDKEIISLVNERLPRGCDVKQVKEIQYRISANRAYAGLKGRGCHNPVNATIKELGLSGRQSHDKFIPEIYRLASVKDRLEIIQGLMDTDGHASKSDPGVGKLTTVSKQLAEDVAFIAQTLGGVGKIRTTRPPPIAVFGNRTCFRREESYTVSVHLPHGMVPFKLSRKAKAYKPSIKYHARRSIVGIELVGEKPCQCIKVQSESGLYLTDNCIVTHNSDPRKDDAWYQKQLEDLDPIVVAQEIDRDYLASVEGVVIPGIWAKACIDAKKVLGIAPSGKRGLAADIADEGRDKNAVCHAHGTEVLWTRERSGKGGDLYETTQWLFALCDEFGYDNFRYDADGLGASVRGDARVINEARAAKRIRTILATGFRGSQSVFNPEGIVEGTIGTGASHGGRIDRGRTNEDYFYNRKAQGWWELRRRARNTYRWVTQGIACPADDILSISSDCKNHMKLVAELSQPTFKPNGVGKILINKAPDNTKSPNLADAVMIHYAPMEAPPVPFTSDMVRQLARAGARRR